jgi:hypothetical protein
MQRQVRLRWAFNGLVIGIICVLADIIFEWRGPKYYPWVGEEAIVNNLAQMFTGRRPDYNDRPRIRILERP